MHVVGEAVQQCLGELFRSEDLGPFVEGEVDGDQDGAPFVALTEDLEEQFSDAQKQWNEQLEAMAKMFAETMSTEDFAKMLGNYMEQGLNWQERMADAVNPQIDAMLPMYNMPSRS